MKSLLVFVFIILCPSLVLSHPGKTDRRGGHKCRKGCTEWGLEYGEYHLHDKDFRPIRLDMEGNPVEIVEPARIQEKIPEAVENQAAVSVKKELPEKQHQEPVHYSRRSESPPYEEGVCSLDGYQLALMAALFFLLACLLAIRARRAVKRR